MICIKFNINEVDLMIDAVTDLIQEKERLLNITQNELKDILECDILDLQNIKKTLIESYDILWSEGNDDLKLQK